MASCLGLFVEENLIKYAKISKDNDLVKIENYGIKFYDNNAEEPIKQIVDETYSYKKTPISINISNEKYTNIEIFSLLSDSDQKKSLKTEFEYYCNETGKNRLTLEYRTIVTQESKDKDKKNALFVYSEKGNIAERIQLLDEYSIANLSPVALTLPNLQSRETGNVLYINLENRTELTTVIDGNPVRVDIIDVGMNDILKKIAERENSISKAYEVCKNATLYTAGNQNLQTEDSEYMELIISSIYKIIEEVKKTIEKNNIEIEKIYLSGTGTIINNIDLYFQENFLDNKCEILTPQFIDRTNLQLNVRDYIEVNSAISLAIQSINKNDKKINFASSFENWNKIKNLLTMDVKSLRNNKTNKANKTKKNMSIQFTNINKIACIRFAYSMFIILLLYFVAVSFISAKINKKIIATQEIIEDTKEKTESLSKQTSLVNSRTQNYETILEQLKENNNNISNFYLSKNAIPNLLNEIMFTVPKQVQVLSINNTDEKHVVIQAQSEQYQYLGYFKSEIQNQAILINVTSTSGNRVNDMIQVTIEGDLPY